MGRLSQEILAPSGTVSAYLREGIRGAPNFFALLQFAFSKRMALPFTDTSDPDLGETARVSGHITALGHFRRRLLGDDTIIAILKKAQSPNNKPKKKKAGGKKARKKKEIAKTGKDPFRKAFKNDAFFLVPWQFYFLESFFRRPWPYPASSGPAVDFDLFWTSIEGQRAVERATNVTWRGKKWNADLSQRHGDEHPLSVLVEAWRLPWALACAGQAQVQSDFYDVLQEVSS